MQERERAYPVANPVGRAYVDESSDTSLEEGSEIVLGTETVVVACIVKPPIQVHINRGIVGVVRVNAQRLLH